MPGDLAGSQLGPWCRRDDTIFPAENEGRKRKENAISSEKRTPETLPGDPPLKRDNIDVFPFSFRLSFSFYFLSSSEPLQVYK